MKKWLVMVLERLGTKWQEVPFTCDAEDREGAVAKTNNVFKGLYWAAKIDDYQITKVKEKEEKRDEV